MRRAAGPEVRGAAAGGPPGAPLPRGPPAPGQCRWAWSPLGTRAGPGRRAPRPSEPPFCLAEPPRRPGGGRPLVVPQRPPRDGRPALGRV